MAVTVVLGIVAAALALVWMLWRKSHTRQLISKLPGPAITPLFGNLLQMPGPPEEYYKFTEDTAMQFRPEGLFKLELSVFRNIVLIFKADYVENLLGTYTHMRKPADYDLLLPWLSTGLLLSSGEKWRSRRRLLTPAFHFKILQDFLVIMNEHSEIFVNKLKEMVDGPAFDIVPMVAYLTLDIICDSAMGQHCSAQNDEDSEYVLAVGRLGVLINERWKKPWLWPDPIFNNVSTGREHNRLLGILHGFTDKVIKQRRAHHTTAGVKSTEREGTNNRVGMKRRLVFLDILLEASLQNQLTDEDIREEVDTFMFAGHDTTATSLAWTLYLIGRHPEVQKKLHEELDDVFGSSNRPATENDLKKLKYLECVFKESQRLYPTVPFFGRVLEEDMTLRKGFRFGEHVIPKGTSVFVMASQLHKDPCYFPDPEKFDPERFNLDNAAGRHPHAYVPFSAGPRNCIGQRFAMMEVKVVLSSTLRHFNIESIHRREEMFPSEEMVLRPTKGAWVKLTHRAV